MSKGPVSFLISAIKPLPSLRSLRDPAVEICPLATGKLCFSYGFLAIGVWFVGFLF